MNKRQWALLISAGLIAAILGIGLSSFKHRTTEAKDQAVELFLKEELKGPDGAIHATKEWRNKILVLNFWASWCPPCVEEMPTLAKAYSLYKDKNVLFVGIGVDSPSNIRQFLEKTPINYPITVNPIEGVNWAKNMGNPSGGLPFTVLVDEKGVIKKTKLGKISEDELKSWLDSAILPSK